MYRLTVEDEDTVIRVKRDLMDQATLARLIDLVNLSAVLEKSRFAGEKEAILARMLGFPTGVALLRDPALNKGTAFTEKEREILGIRGLLPPRVHSMEEQVSRTLENFRRKPNDIEKYIFMISLQDRNKTLFYRVVTDHIEEILVAARGRQSL